MPVEVREHDVVPLVEVLPPENGLDALGLAGALSSPDNACQTVVHHVLRASGESEVSDSVVVPDPIVVVDLYQRVVAVVQKPRKTMRQIRHAKNLDGDVPVVIASTGNGAGFAGAASGLPRYIARIRVVLEDIANFIWDNCKIHTVSPHVVVRGRSALTGRTPDYTPLGAYC